MIGLFDQIELAIIADAATAALKLMPLMAPDMPTEKGSGPADLPLYSVMDFF